MAERQVKKSGFQIPTLKSEADANWFEKASNRRSTEKLVRVTVDLEPELHRRLKIKAAMEGKSIASLIRDWTDEKTQDLKEG